MNMKLFLVRVGRKTRGGNIQELVNRSISVPEDVKVQDLYKYFCPRYKGFNVVIEQPECEELPDLTVDVRVESTEPVKKRGSIAFRIRHNEQEAALFKEYCELTKKADDRLRDIEISVRDRYSRLPYVRNRSDIKLSTDTNGTFCDELPIKSNDFFRVIKDCNDGTAALEIIPNTGTSTIDDSDIPY